MRKKLIWAFVRITFLAPIVALLFFCMGSSGEDNLINSFVGIELYALIETFVFYNRCQNYPKVIRNSVILFIYTQLIVIGYAFLLFLAMFG